MAKSRTNSFKQRHPKDEWSMFDKFMNRPIEIPVEKIIDGEVVEVGTISIPIIKMNNDTTELPPGESSGNARRREDRNSRN